uniref:Uncharacterized protein n=1 Tax=Chlamydomonas leiostraca TaxID=1034604 RepID=A0A7S0WVH7_9CHLO
MGNCIGSNLDSELRQTIAAPELGKLNRKTLTPIPSPTQSTSKLGQGLPDLTQASNNAPAQLPTIKMAPLVTPQMLEALCSRQPVSVVMKAERAIQSLATARQSFPAGAHCSRASHVRSSRELQANHITLTAGSLSDMLALALQSKDTCSTATVQDNVRIRQGTASRVAEPQRGLLATADDLLASHQVSLQVYDSCASQLDRVEAKLQKMMEARTSKQSQRSCRHHSNSLSTDKRQSSLHRVNKGNPHHISSCTPPYKCTAHGPMHSQSQTRLSGSFPQAAHGSTSTAAADQAASARRDGGACEPGSREAPAKAIFSAPANALGFTAAMEVEGAMGRSLGECSLLGSLVPSQTTY